MKAKINVLIIGVGHDHAHDTFSYITSENSSYNLLGIVLVPKDEANYTQWKADYDRYPRYSLYDALNMKGMDAVLVECDDSLLTEYALRFAEKGIPVHMDKPGGQDAARFNLLVDTCEKNNVPFHLGYMYRYNPAIRHAHMLAEKGEFGKIHYIEAQMNIAHPKAKRQWLAGFEGGMMNFLGCHLVDLVVSFLGKPDSVTSYNTASEPDVGNDIGFAILRYGNTFSTVNSTAVEIDGYSRRHIVICGEKATVEICPTELVKNGYYYAPTKFKVTEFTENIKEGEHVFGPFLRYDTMFEEFASIVRGEIPNPYSYQYEKDVHETLMAACGPYGKETKL